MNTEQKAERYDEAIERAKEWSETKNGYYTPKELCEEIFPELKESEGEVIRKKLLSSFKCIMADADEDELWYGLPYNDIIAWLEKQGENHIVGNNEMVKPIDKVEQKSAVLIPKFHVGDKLVSTYNTSLTYEVLEVGHINKLGNPDYKVEIFTDGKAENPRNIHYMECYKVDEWAKLIEQKPAWSEEDEAGLGDALWAVQQARTLAKDENDMGNLWYAENWLNALKGRLQPKQEWSKEDEAHIDSLLKRLEGICKPGAAFISTRFAISEDEDWLRNIKYRNFVRPQNRWKPSVEQMKALEQLEEMHVLGCEKTKENAHLYVVIKSLKEQLKQL